MMALARRCASTVTLLSTLAWTQVFADTACTAGNCGILAGAKSQEAIRNGDFHFDDIPNLIKYATNILLGFTATISMIAIIVGGYKYAIGAYQSDTQEGKKAIIYGITGFVISSLAWLIVRVTLSNI